MKATVTPSCSARSVIDLALPPSICRRQRCARTSALIRVSSRRGFGEHDPPVVNFFRQLFARHRVQSVLDCACGTGRDLHLFHSLGCRAVGSDISTSMLARAKANLSEAGLRVPLHQADYRQLPQHFQERFDAVACLSSSILEMPDEHEALRALQSIREVLHPGGILILSQGTTDRQWRERPRFILAVNDDDFSRVFAIDYFESGARYNLIDIYHGEQRRGLETWNIELAQILLRDDLDRLLKLAGFASVRFYGGYSFEAYDKEKSNLLIAVACKGDAG